jgi:hypothetical protein
MLRSLIRSSTGRLKVKKEYDFSEGERGKFLCENKVQKTLQVDAELLKYFQSLSTRKRIP